MKKESLILNIFLMIVFMVTSCGSGGSNETTSSDEVIMGTQVWMCSNLNVDKFRNGDPIPQAKTTEEWRKAGEERRPVWSYYNNNPANGGKYGKLYNWYAVADPRNICPAGWHVPSDKEWTVLIDYLGGESAAFTKMMSASAVSNDYIKNTLGFSALPAGLRYGNGGFGFIDSYGSWWSSTSDVTGQARGRDLDCANGIVDENTEYKGNGFSVRCIRD